MNRKVILLILQLETDYFSSYSFQRIRSSGITVFTETSRNCIPLILHEEVQGILQILHSTQVPIQNPILHTEGKEIFNSSYKTFQRPSRHSSHKTFQGHSSIPVIFQTFQSFMTFSLPGITTHSSTSSTFQCIQGFTPLQHSPIRMHILHFDWFPQKLHRVPVETLQTLLQTFILQRKGDVAISVKDTIGHISQRCQDDIYFKIELIPAIVLSSRVTN